jgi:hypothetical protein
MPESRVVWLSDLPPTPEDHAAFALDKQRERLLAAARTALNDLSSEQLAQVVEMATTESGEVSNG